MEKVKGTTIFVPRDIHEALVLLKLELRKETYAEVLSTLIKSYQELHGWSTVSLAAKLKEILETEPRGENATDNKSTLQDNR